MIQLTFEALFPTERAASDPHSMVDHPKRRRARYAVHAERFSSLLRLLRGRRRRAVEKFVARSCESGSDWWGIPAADVEIRRSMVNHWVSLGWIECVYDGEGYTLCVLPKWLEDARAS
jgi:hypothetical protein